MQTSVFLRGFGSELVKVSARAGLKIIRNLLQRGGAENIAKAERLAITPGVIKKTGPGSQIKHLGAGMEGVSTLVAHPKKGIAVRKVYDPKGIATPELIARKGEVGRKLKGSSDVAEFLGGTQTRVGPAHFYEHVPGKTLEAKGLGIGSRKRSSGEATTAVARPQGSKPKSAISDVEQRAGAQIKRLKQQANRMGVSLKDLHEGNVIAMPGRASAGPARSKAVDYIPGGGETPLPINYVNLARGHHDPAYRAYLADPRRPGNVMARAFRGAPPLVPGSSKG